MQEFEGRTVLVSGASGNLGAAVTSAFLRAKTTVAGVARSWKGRASQDPRFVALAADLTAADGIRSSVPRRSRGSSGVTANIILPSTIDTPENRAAMPDQDPSRWVRPESIAALLLWLATDASAEINGARILIYGKA